MGVKDKYTRVQNKTNLKQKKMHLLHKHVKISVRANLSKKTEKR